VVSMSLAVESCGKRRLVAVAGPGLPIADERESMPIMVECPAEADAEARG
jgi:hypothetical protein